ncbi:hypothetical protein A6A27_34965 [Micromonospora sp. CB01531]|nr:hypothetical protein A6A27_34965 [Micromonospora sp. CB01531]
MISLSTAARMICASSRYACRTWEALSRSDSSPTHRATMITIADDSVSPYFRTSGAPVSHEILTERATETLHGKPLGPLTARVIGA